MAKVEGTLWAHSGGTGCGVGVAFFKEERYAEVLDQLHAKMELIVPAAPKEGRRLAGAKFVFTGGLEAMSRDEAKARSAGCDGGRKRVEDDELHGTSLRLREEPGNSVAQRNGG